MLHARLAAVAAAAVLVAGCSPAPSVAAIVGNEEITNEFVDQVISDCQAAVGGEPLTGQVVVGNLTISAVFDAVAAEAGFEFTDDEVAMMLEQRGMDAATIEMVSGTACMDFVRPVATSMLISSVVDEATLVAAVREIDVEINPRYGEWDPSTGAVGGSGSLSVTLEG